MQTIHSSGQLEINWPPPGSTCGPAWVVGAGTAVGPTLDRYLTGDLG